MNEIEKMYENAGIKKKPYCELNCYITKNDFECTSYCLHYEDENLYYPNFTAEKQLELIKWLMREKYLIGRYIEGYYELFTNSMISYNSKNECFEKSLAGLINNLWQSLTEEEKEQIRGILNGN